MSSNIWTPTEVVSNAEEETFELWRAVEAQHKVSTMTLVDTLDEQEQLEQLLEASKPPISDQWKEFHWLQYTPFRYPPTGDGSRFRGVTDSGVFYGADEIATACAELGFWRWRFLLDSPSLQNLTAKLHTVFRVGICIPTIDLRRPPLSAYRSLWVEPGNYTHTQELARSARSQGIGAIRYESVRDPEKGGCGAILSLSAFCEHQPRESQTWWLSVTRSRVLWTRDDALHPKTHEFIFIN